MKIIAHRGVHSSLPENSQLSFDAALKAGSDMIEFDIQLTRDKIAVVSHDNSLLRTHSIDALISSLTHSQLSQLTGSILPIMTLESVLQRYGNHIGLNIELKSIGSGEAVARIILKRSRRLNLETLLVSSFHATELRDFQTICSRVAVSRLFKKYPLVSILLTRTPRLEVVSFAHDKLPPQWVIDYLKLRGFGVYCYTVNDPSEAKELATRGIDGIFCDDAPTMKQNLQS